MGYEINELEIKIGGAKVGFMIWHGKWIRNRRYKG